MADKENGNTQSSLDAGLPAGPTGLQIGIVRKIDDVDPLAAARVLLDLPLIDSERQGIWARVGSLYATRAAGIASMPEIGDEVLVGFINNDPHQPVVLGSLYGSHRELPDAVKIGKETGNGSGLRITLQDSDKSVTIETPGGRIMVMSDKDASIRITDAQQNNIQLSTNGISLSSPKDIAIKASGTVTIQGDAGVSVKSTNRVKVEGAQIDVQAATNLTLAGTASATLNASGKVDIHGAFVTIN